MKQSLLKWGLLTAITLVLLGCSLYAADIVPRTEPIQWEMQAWEVAEDGTVLGAHTVYIEGKLLHYRKSSDRLYCQVQVSEGCPYGVDSYDEGYSQHFDFFDRLGIFYTSMFGWEGSEKDTRFLTLAMDPEKGCLILRPIARAEAPDAPRTYLVASTEPNATPQQILEHFPWFPDYS